jgi:DNA primase
MRFAPRTSGVYETLKAQIDLAELVGQFAELEDRGNTKDCFCPINEQSSKNPAFKIYDDSFYCFSCEAHGDVTSFWKLIQGFASNWDAAQDLARKYNIELPQMDPEARKRYEERRQREEGWAWAAQANHERLLGGSASARKAREYLTDRGFTEEHWRRFQLGVDAAGQRVTIPYWSGGQIHGQVARALGDDLVPKYLYPKAEEFALKRRTLFMQDSPRSQEYLLVEGFFDQLASEALGIPAIAAGSAGFSKEQTADLLDMAKKGATFVISRDKDERGRERAQDMLEKLYPYARLMPDLPGDGKDLADFYREHGEAAAEEIRDLMEEGEDAVELALARLGASERPAKKVRLLKSDIVPLLLQIPDRSERGAVVKELSGAPGLNKEIVQDAITEVEGRLIVETHETPEEQLPESDWGYLLEPGVLGRYVSDAFKIKSVVGEEDKNVVKLLVSNALEAQLEPLPTGKPIGGAIMLTGDSGRGKNFLADAAVCGLPEEWYLSFEAASATAFYYAAEVDPAFLKHKFIYPNEAEAVDTVVEFLRPMFSQAKAKKFVTNKNSDGSHVFQELQVEGPITGVVPTTRNTLNKELQTRMLVCELPNYDNRIKEHTAALSRQFSPDFVADPHGHMVPKWRAALASLTGIRKVVIPFGNHEMFRLENEEIGHGARLWGNLLGLMCAHAWLEQRNREVHEVRDGTRAVVATAADYKAAYELLESVAARSIVNLGDTHRKIVKAVYELRQDAEFKDDGFSSKQIADHAGISKGTVSKNRTFLVMSAGLLYETDDKRLNIYEDADPSWWESGDAMNGFPRPSEVDRWDTPPPDPGNGGNAETLGQKPLTYVAEPVSYDGNAQETLETVSTNGPDPLADYPKAEAPTWARESSERVLEYDPDEPANFWDLSEDERDRVLAWIRSRFTPHPWLRLKVGYLRDSYNFKGLFERSRGGFYIDNGAFKGAMLEAGFTPVSPDDGWAWSLEDMAFDQNWSFRGKQIYDPDPYCKLEQMEWALDAIRGWPRPVSVGVAAKERRIPRAKVGKLTSTLLFCEKEGYARFTDGGWETTWRVPDPPRRPARLNEGK